MRPEIIFGGTGLLGSNYLLNKKNKIIYNIIHKKRAYNAKNIKIDMIIGKVQSLKKMNGKK